MEITITPVVGTELYNRYPRQSSPQDCYVELDCETGALSADSNAEIGNAVPARVWHGHCQRWTIPALRADSANALLATLEPLAARVCAGYECIWDGSNHVARFDDDAQEAIEEIAALCGQEVADASPETCVRAWDAGEWYANEGDQETAERLGITAATTDAELDAMVEAEEAEALSSSECDEIDGIDKHLRRIRDELVAALPECEWCSAPATTTDLDGDPSCAAHAHDGIAS